MHYIICHNSDLNLTKNNTKIQQKYTNKKDLNLYVYDK